MSFTVDKAIQITDATGRLYALLVTGMVAVKAEAATARAALDALNDAPTLGGIVGNSASGVGFVATENNAVATLRAAAVLKMFPALDVAALAYGQEIGEASILNFKTYLQWFNQGGGGAWSALVSPDFALAHQWVNGGSASAYIGAKQVYSPANSNIATKTVGGALVQGTAIDTTLYAGAARPQLVVTGITGSGQVDAVGTAYDATGFPRSGRTFRAAVTGNGTFDLTPNVTGDLLTGVTDVIYESSITAGTLKVTAAIPTNAPNRVAS